MLSIFVEASCNRYNRDECIDCHVYEPLKDIPKAEWHLTPEDARVMAEKIKQMDVLQQLANQEINLTLGGPIVRDRAWFYAGYANLSGETDVPIRTPNEKFESDLFDLKVTADFGVNHRAWVGLHYEDRLNENTTWGDTWDETMVYHTGSDNFTWSAQYQWVIGDSNLFGFKALGFETDENELLLVWEGGSQLLAMDVKTRLACRLVECIADLYRQRSKHEYFSQDHAEHSA